jgi:hypothetical protein
MGAAGKKAVDDAVARFARDVAEIARRVTERSLAVAREVLAATSAARAPARTPPRRRRPRRAPLATPPIAAADAATSVQRRGRRGSPAAESSRREEPPASSPNAPAAAVSDALVDEIAASLGDAVPRGTVAWFHYHAVVSEIGAERAREIVDRARAVEAGAGMMACGEDRKRTLGGIFFAFARERIDAARWRALRKLAHERARAHGAAAGVVR